MIWSIIYLIVCMAWGLLAIHLDLSFRNWEYWGVLVGFVMSYVCGAYRHNDI